MPSSSSPPSFPARTTFFSTSFPSLHDLVLDHLSGSDSRHLVLSLLAVNRYWRKIAQEYLLRSFKNAKVAIVKRDEDSDEDESTGMEPVWDGEYIKVVISAFSPQDGPFEECDPRIHFTDQPPSPDFDEGEDDEDEERVKPVSPEVRLFLKYYDPLTGICTFVPPPLPPSDDNDKEVDEDDDAMNPLSLLPFPSIINSASRLPFTDPVFINAIPSTWFVPEREEGSGLFGLEVACDRDAFPDCYPFTDIPVPKKPGGFEEKVSEGWKDDKDWRKEDDDPDIGKEDLMRHDWKLKFGAVRGDSEDEDPSTYPEAFPGTYQGETAAVIFSLELPLVHLFQAPGLRSDSYFW